VRADVRLISATNRDLVADVKSGRFREDLFYRLHVFPISVPALSERREDIPALARYFLARFAAEEGKRIRGVDPAALSLLAAFRWPGNVRQLENAVFRAVVLADGDELTAAEFPQIASLVSWHASADHDQPVQTFEPAVNHIETEDLPIVNDSGALVGSIAPQPAEMTAMLSLLDASGEVRALDEVETEAIRFAIAHYRGQMSEVARRLRIGRSTLYRKLDALGLGQRMNEIDSEPVVTG
jgi:DNA-binding NtrC family response regulator